MTSDIQVFHGDLAVGHIEARPDGPSFAYTEDWLARRTAFPASVSMPLVAAPVPPDIIVPWLANLLPEGAALTTAGRWLGLDPRDVVGMVEQVGRDAAGALSFGRPWPGAAPRHIAIPDETALERIIEELPRRPFLLGEEGVSLTSSSP